MKSSFLPKYESKIVRISFIFWEKRRLHKFILKFIDLYLQRPKNNCRLIFPSHSLSKTSELLAKYVVHQQPCAALFRHTRPFFAKPLLLAFSACSQYMQPWKMPWFPCKINFSLPLGLFLDFSSKYNTYPEKMTDYAIDDFIVLSSLFLSTS